MGFSKKRDYSANKRLRKYVDDNMLRPSIVADRAGIRRDTFSQILACNRVIYAEEIVPICKATGCDVYYLLGLHDLLAEIPNKEGDHA